MAFISKKIENLINFRIVEEEKSSRLYLAMSKWLSYNGYNGASKLWKKYSDEELVHVEWAYTYLEDLDILPIVPALELPQREFKSLPDICKLSFEHEMLVTKQVNELAKIAQTEGDYMTMQLAQKYLTEQTEEIMKVTRNLDLLEMQGGDNISKESLLLVDNIMGEWAE